METLLSHCTLLFSEHGNVFFTFFLGGLTGSFTHCLIMCAPVVACQSACGGSCGKRLSNAAQWQYHLGRLMIYGALGFFAALFAAQFTAYTNWNALSSGMMIAAGALFVGSAIFPQTHPLLRFVPQNGFLRGVMMSFMPCGLIYAALMMAATLAHPMQGMIAMWLFVLGTIPALLIASGSAAALAKHWQQFMQTAGRFGMAFNGLALLVLAAKTMR